ncbi:NAD(P)/FAD-dependent oxidoreductase [Candidatus Uhrbacteria bacterium]|nr:NAD(P)/FAD-dependent oxidoreductase [Candidatus Uhrbacteria bacterium]
MKQHIVIIGSGFGGMEVAKRLAPKVRRGEIDVTVINRTNYFLFTPLLHEVATGGLTPTSVTEPLRDVFARSGIRVAQGDVAGVDIAAKNIRVGTCDIPYDIVVLASGAETNYYGVPGADAHGVGLKTLSDAIRIRERVIDAFEAAALTNDEEAKRRLLSFVVVGAGATGVELVAELAEFATGIAEKYFGGTHGVSVTLVSASAELLAQFSPATRKAAEERLRKNGIVLKLGVQVLGVDTDGVDLGDGSRIDASLVAWTAGVKPVVPTFTNGAPEMTNGRIAVDATLAARGVDGMFVLGDSAATPSPLPMLAQVAVAQGKTVAQNVVAKLAGRPLHPFAYRSKGSLVSLGQWFAAGTVGAFDISGRFTWWLWRTVYLFKFASTKKRIRIAFEWTINLFYPRDITKLT